MTKMLIVRHGQTEWNATERVQGQCDISLDDVGLDQARRLALALGRNRADLIISSDLRRTTQTAQPIADLTGLPIELDPRLRERNYGLWQGLHRTEIAQRYPDEYARWRAGERLTEHGIETVEDLTKRVGQALRDAIERVGTGTAVVVTHGVAARIGTGWLLGWPHSAVKTLGVLQNCHYTELRRVPERGWVLRAHNLGPAVSVGS
jgi:glucosyl-3-phosphoglycerate phosphatase